MEKSEHKTDGPRIKCQPNGPYFMTDVDVIVDEDGRQLAPKQQRVLCRCGHSKLKPFCDGSHLDIGFEGSQVDRKEQHSKTYSGESLTVYFNESICSQCGECHQALPSVFGSQREVNLQEESERKEEIIKTILDCPSGALSFSTDDPEAEAPDREVSVCIEKDGPLRVSGNIALQDVKWAERASRDRYTLCRCGTSGNKPFCDGSHRRNGFRSDNLFKIAELDQLTKELTRVSIGRRELVIVKRGDVLSVFSGACLHAEALLSEGFIEGDFLTCGKHLWRYDINTGVLDGDPSMHLLKLTPHFERGALLVSRDELEKVEEIDT